MSSDKTNITDFFGVNVRMEFEDYIANVFTPWFHANYGEESEFAGFILDPAQTPDWQNPDQAPMLRFSTTSPGESQGLFANVRGKARFALRTGLPSSEAASQKWRVLPGDFPYAGFIFYKGFAIGGSGVKQESDEFLCRKIIDEGLVPYMTAAVADVIGIVETARKRGIDVGDWKYLDGTAQQLSDIGHQSYVAQQADEANQ